MVESAEREPTMEEIVVALRETRRRAGKPSPLTVVTTPRPGPTDDPPAGELRDREIERLLAENARLNERTMFLLKLLERAEAYGRDPAIGRTVSEALQAELRPVMLVLLRLLEKQRDGNWIVDFDRENRQ